MLFSGPIARRNGPSRPSSDQVAMALRPEQVYHVVHDSQRFFKPDEPDASGGR